MKDVKKKAGSISCVAAVMLLCCARGTDADYTMVTLYVSGNPRNPDVALGKLDLVGGAAYGTLNDSLLSTGWAELEVRSGYGGGRGAIGDSDVAFLAGYVEGYLTARHINNHFKNLYPTFIKDNKTHAILEDFLRKQDSWARVQSRENHNDPFWRNVDYVLSQLDGMIAGATRRNAEHGIKTDLSFPALYLNAVGDVIDLVNALVPSRRPPWLSLSRAEAKRLVQKSGHCSALIKILPGYENIFMSHSSWFTYAATMRIFKHWDLNILDTSMASRQMSFSSYPGFLESLDDYYLLSSGLVLLQTTNNVFNESLYAAITPLSLLAWQRVRVANMMARGGRQWGQVFSRHNSGEWGASDGEVEPPARRRSAEIGLWAKCSVDWVNLTHVRVFRSRYYYDLQLDFFGGFWPCDDLARKCVVKSSTRQKRQRLQTHQQVEGKFPQPNFATGARFRFEIR